MSLMLNGDEGARAKGSSKERRAETYGASEDLLHGVPTLKKEGERFSTKVGATPALCPRSRDFC